MSADNILAEQVERLIDYLRETVVTVEVHHVGRVDNHLAAGVADILEQLFGRFRAVDIGGDALLHPPDSRTACGVAENLADDPDRIFFLTTCHS